MSEDEARNLVAGDEVFWNDPDDGQCSRVVSIASIEVNDGVAVIREKDGSVLECFVSELE